MDKQKGIVFKQNNRWGLTALSVVLCMLLSPILGMTMLLPQVLMLLPVVLLALLSYVGPVSAAACSAVLIAMCSVLFGTWGAVAAGLFLIPVLVVSGVLAEQNKPFWFSAGVSCVTIFVSIGLVIGLLTALSRSDLVSAITLMLTQVLGTSGEVADALLSAMAQLGVLTAEDGSAVVLAALSDAQRTAMLQSLILMMDSMLRLEIPMQMASGSIAVGLLGQAALRKGMRARGQDVAYCPLRTWLVPKGWGGVLGITLAALFGLNMLMPDQMASTYYVFGGVFEQIFALQGIAAACCFLHERGKRSLWQGVVFVVGYIVLRPAAVIVGIADQAFDIVHRRGAEAEGKNNLFHPRDPHQEP